MATQQSDLQINKSASPQILNLPSDDGGNTGIYRWRLTGIIGIDGEVYEMCTVKRNDRVLTPYCRLNIPDQGAGVLVSMGWLAYQDAEGNTIAADDSGFFSALDVATGPIAGLIDTLTVTGLLEDKLFEGDAVLTLTLTVAATSAGAFSGTIFTSRT